MWSPDHRAAFARVFRSALAIGSAGLLAACFQPLYGQPPLSGAPTIGDALAAVDVQQIDAPRGSGNADIEAAVLAVEAVRRALDGKPPRKVIIVPQRIVNVVA